MWRSTINYPGAKAKAAVETNDDDWDTDPDFVNDVSEKQQRWGSKTIEGSGRIDSVDIDKLRNEVKTNETEQKEAGHSSVKFSQGYGGKFGVQTDRVDKSAVGFDGKEVQKEKN